MTPPFKQIYALLWLICYSGPGLLCAQPGAYLEIHPAVWKLVHFFSNEKKMSILQSEELDVDVFYHSAQIHARFGNALQLQHFVAPPHSNATYFFNQFPDTAYWQQQEKREMQAALRDAINQKKIGSNVIFVRQNGKGDGSSWRNAYGDLQEALHNIKRGQEIWVAAGTYFPSQKDDRYASFVIPDSVRLYGGFLGYETDRYRRHWDKNLTILSGEIGDEDIEDNVYTVVHTKQVGTQTLLDGFVITGGYADGVQQLGDPRRSGGGWYNDGAGGKSSPTIANCLFIHNYARDGAGFYSFAQAGEASPIFIDCQFINNRADLDGGGLFIDSRNGFSEINIIHCFFTDNRANFGSAIGNRSELGQSILSLERSVFETNIAYVRKVIHNADNGSEGEEVSFLKFERACRFADNISVVGGDENTTAVKGHGKKLKRGEIAYLAF